MIFLPKNIDDRIAVLKHMITMADQEARLQRIRWSYSYHWLQGIRNIEIDYDTGSVRCVYDAIDEEERVRYEAILPKLQAEFGQLYRMDVRPATSPKGFGLDALRKSSTGRVILDYLTGSVDWDRLKTDVFLNTLCYGMIGLGVWIKEYNTNVYFGAGEGATGADDVYDSRVVLECIPPWELLSVPARPRTPNEVEAIIRRRWVPLEWLRSRTGLKLGSDEVKLGVREAPFGVRPDEMAMTAIPGAEYFTPEPSSTPMGSSSNRPSSGNPNIKYAPLSEFWFCHDQKERLARYLVLVGDQVAFDQEYPTPSKFMPIATARNYPTTGFYGRAFVEVLIPLNKQVEKMAQSLFENVEDLDAYGIALIPESWGVNISTLKKKGRTRKITTYEPDISLPEARMEAITPITTSDFPGKVLAAGEGMFDRMVNQSAMLRGEAPGRVDSAIGLETLHETASIPLSVPAASIAGAFCQIYRAILGAAASLLGDKDDLPLIGLDDSFFGLQVLPNSSRVKIQPDNIPLPTEIELDIRDRLPTSPAIRKKELQDAFAAQLITPWEFKVHCWKENIDFPVGSWQNHENYRKAVLNTIFLFGDGQTPGMAVGSDMTDNPDVHLEVIQTFMAKPEFQMASREVQMAFEQLKNLYLGMKGGQYPQQMPYPEDAAAQQQMIQEQMDKMSGGEGGGGMPSGMPPEMIQAMGGGVPTGMPGQP